MYAVFQSGSKERDVTIELSLTDSDKECLTKIFDQDEQDDSYPEERDFSSNPRKKHQPTGVARNRRIANKKRNRKRR